MTHTNDAPVTVEHCDREAAADLIETYWRDADASMMKLAASYRGGHSQGVFARAFARHRLAALVSAPAGDDGDFTATVRVSRDGKSVQVEHKFDADWEVVLRVHEALRDWSIQRIEGHDTCPFRPVDARDPVAPAGDGLRPVPQAWIDRAMQIEAAADGLVSMVNDAIQRAKEGTGRLYAANIGQLDKWAEQVLEAINLPEPVFPPALARPRAAVGEREA